GYGPLAVDFDGNVFVIKDHSIQKFQPVENEPGIISYILETEWGAKGIEPGQFNDPQGIAVDSVGNVYVGEFENDRVQKFSSEGDFLMEINNAGGGINGVLGVTLDSQDYLYVTSWGSGIQKYSPEGQLITVWGDGGDGPGQISEPSDLSIGPDGAVFIADTSYSRLQVFKKLNVLTNSKAIIVAGGGNFSGNNLWNATQMTANFAYRTLTYQGYTKNSIYYITSDTDLDLDSNGVADDVDADATNANLQDAITEWASDADNLVVYLVDHGGDGTFRMSGTETLSAEELDSWLDQAQIDIPGKITVIYDACESGSFMSQLTPPEGKERIVIGSTSPGESAYFVTQGSISFSSFFWTHIFNGLSVKEAFDLASQSITNAVDQQHPLLDDDGDGVGNGEGDGILSVSAYIGNGTIISGDAPVIESVTPGTVISDTNSALLYAEGVTDADDIARVWAVIRPPNYQQGSSYNPVYELPSIDLMPTDVENRWEATYNNFDIPGTYYIAIYARDRVGNTSIPSITTISVNSPLSKKALIIAAGNVDDQLWPAVRENSYLAYNILKFQGYTEDNIYLMSDNSISDEDIVDEPSTISNLESVLSNWAITDTNDLVIYMIGKSNKREFWMNQTEKIAPDELDTLLDTVQESIPGMLTVIYDGDYSGSFVSDLTPPTDKTRIVVTSAADDQSVHFITDGDLSFSRFFWGRVLNGTNVRDSFIYAKTAMAYLAGQTPVLDDNGNGIGNEKADGIESRNYSIGTGIMLAGDDPIIGEVSPMQTIEAGGTASIWASNITTTGSIDSSSAVVTSPTGVITTAQLTDDGTGKYEGSYNGFYYYGEYSVIFYAEDLEGNISFPVSTTINYNAGPDVFEDNDSLETAGIITVDEVETHIRSFHDAGDEDWVKFYGIKDETYEIVAENLESSCDATIMLYDSDGDALLKNPVDTGWYGDKEFYTWICPEDGIYYVQVKQYYSSDFGPDTGYELKVNHFVEGTTGTLSGIVTNELGESLGGAIIRSDTTNAIAITYNDGTYELVLPSGTYSLSVDVSGYVTYGEEEIVIEAEGYVSHDFILYPNIDSDNDGTIDYFDTDDDNDGMPDEWEIYYDLDPLFNDADEDADGDGFKNIFEYLRETDPLDPESHPSKGLPWLMLLLEDG
ncbi:C13 family peptidase, partial [Thermodesulfobacteriota bacterium]